MVSVDYRDEVAKANALDHVGQGSRHLATSWNWWCAFREESADLDRVVSALAESRVLYLFRESGKPATDVWRSVVLGQYRLFFFQFCL